MLSINEWKNIRRVDHVNLGVFHPRHRTQTAGVAPMDAFDVNVAAYPAATNNFDKVTLLGAIIRRARVDYLTAPVGTIPQRYLDAVQRLYASAVQDMNQICGVLGHSHRLLDLEKIGRGTPLPGKIVTLNVFFIAPIGAAPVIGPIDATIDNHINHANLAAGFAAANLSFVRSNAVAQVISATAAGESILLPSITAVPAHMQGKFADGAAGGERLIEFLNNSGGAAKSIDIVYLDHYDQADVQGRTFRAGADYGSKSAARPIVTVTLNPPADGAATYPTTLAHELGHAITGEPGHSTAPDNLMAGGSIRMGTDRLPDGLRAWFRNSAYI